MKARRPTIPFQLNGFSIHKLHGTRTISIPIKNNRMILVGKNGLGKTTVITILFRILSQQWEKLLDFRFEKATLHFAQKDIEIRREEIEASILDWNRLRRFLPSHALARLRRTPELVAAILRLKDSSQPNEWISLSEKLEIPTSMLERLFALSTSSQINLFPQHKSGGTGNQGILEASQFLTEKIASQVLYLPTYRRIEKDLKTIFPKFEEQVKNFNEKQETQSDSPAHYIELVEFGMEDVAAKFNTTITALKETARSGLNSLVGTYLREIIRGEVKPEDTSAIKGLNDSTITRILNRVEEKTLNQEEKKRLHGIIIAIKTSPDRHLTSEDSYIARFFSKLITLDQSLSTLELAIQSFVKVCSEYLQNKRITYDEQNYAINLRLDNDQPLSLKDLSSGEKQIVSLFSHIYLEPTRRFAVIIDEPELSLSVDWQRRLLPDIINSRRCSFLAAATHSPYAFDNELEIYAEDLAEHVKEAQE
ncbi:MAG: ATP-binding protein [Acidovorax sp.]|nr:MAG: ATP-binding protein [Acidovorax sp.]